MADPEPFEEWLEDFGGPRQDEATIQRLLERARSDGDVELRRALKEVQMWRWLTPHLLDRVAPLGTPTDESDQFLTLARFVVRGEGAIGAA
jgi:hypothetical protein